MAHPVQTVLESLYAAERCPRLHVDATKKGVVCPDFVRDQWRERLVIDLDASYPLALEMDADGLSADLSFGGYVSRCSFPWGSIYVVTDRDSGRGIVLEQNVPATVREQMDAARRPKPKLAAVEDEEDASHERTTDPELEESAADADDTAAPSVSSSAPVTSSDDGAPAGLAAVIAPAARESLTPPPEASSPAPEPTTTSTAASSEEHDHAARRRRAAFRVIDGGS